jgi:hypothetical protein
MKLDPLLKITNVKGAGRMVQVVKPSKHEALSSTPILARTQMLITAPWGFPAPCFALVFNKVKGFQTTTILQRHW